MKTTEVSKRITLALRSPTRALNEKSLSTLAREIITIAKKREGKKNQNAYNLEQKGIKGIEY